MPGVGAGGGGGGMEGETFAFGFDSQISSVTSRYSPGPGYSKSE